MEYGFVQEKAAAIHARINAACARSNRNPGDVQLMAVSKLHPIEAVEAAYECGIRLFGENRIQEAQGKFPGFLSRHPDARLDMIGHLQSNKAKKAIGLFSCVQSVDSVGLLLELGKRSEASGMCIDVLFELHTGEESKSGFPDTAAMLSALELLPRLPLVRLRGLMTMAPFVRDEGLIRASFKAVKAAFTLMAVKIGAPSFDILSMGMSNDFEMAIEEGSTLIRIGTSLFGVEK